MENTLSRSDLRQLLLITFANWAATAVAFLAASAAVVARDGAVTAWMCIATFAVFHLLVSTAQQGQDFASRIVISIAADVVVVAALAAAEVGRLALTALAVHYVLFYTRVTVLRALRPAADR
jgi:hypothetical protein